MSSFLPQYSTASGDAHGYNERSGMSTAMYSNRYENGSFRGAPTWGIQARDNTNLKPSGRLATGGFPSISPTRTAALPNFAATRDVTVQVSSPPRADPASAFSPKHEISRNVNVPRPRALEGQPGASFRSSQADVSIRSIDSVGPMGDILNLPREPPTANKPRLSFDQEQSAMSNSKDSISQRLPEVERLRYHVPGYMGFVRRQQFHHGQTYGATTRSCILGYKPDSTPAL